MTNLTDLHRALLCKARTRNGKYATVEHRDEWEHLVQAGYAMYMRRSFDFEREEWIAHYRLTDEGEKQAESLMGWWQAQQERR